MNRAYKVVYNKARGVLMVANEITSSVQAKGTKTVVATAVASLMAVSSFAANAEDAFGSAAFSFNGETVLQNSSAASYSAPEVVKNNDGTTTITFGTVSNWTSEGGQPYGAFTNLRTVENNKPVKAAFTVSGTFENNTSANAGGAMTIWHVGDVIGEEKLHTITGTFTGNSATNEGGAVSLMAWGAFEAQGLTNISGTFENNKAGKTGGAIYAQGNDLTVSNSVFTTNTATSHGGAIYIEPGKNTSLVVANGTETTFTSFIGNVSGDQGGAIYNGGVSTVGDYTFFKGNKATVAGGAIATGEGTTVSMGNNVTFDANTSNMGGAVFNQRATMTIGQGAIFTNNQADGGAQAQSGGADAGSGGAIMNQANGWEQTKHKSSLTIGDSARFEGNTATNRGGAIANYAWTDNSQYANDAANVTLTIGQNAQFTGNKAGTFGGAIYNDGTVVFKGNATFSGNTAGDVLNDIHNTGAMTVEAGTLTLDGGITGNGTLTFADGSALTVKLGNSQADSTTIANKVTVGDNVTLSMTFAPGYLGEYALITEDGSLNGEFVLADNAVYDVTAVADKSGVYNIAVKSTAELVQSTGADTNQAAAIGAVMSATSTNETFNTIATSIAEGLQSSDPVVKQAAIDAVTVMSPEVAPMVTQVQSDTATQVNGLIGNRLGGSSSGMASGDQPTGIALWAQGMFGKTDMDDTSKARGYTADTTGFAIGLEAKPADAFTIGAGFAYADVDVEGFMRDTDVESMTAFLYGEYKPSNWYVNGIVSYAWANYEEAKSVAGVGVDAKYDADTFGVQVMTGLDMAVAGVKVSPEVGLRYFHIGTDAYTDTAGTSVKESNEDILTGVLGARVSTAIDTAKSVRFVPEAHVAMTYDFVEADNNSFVTLANGSSYAMEGETLDRFGVEAGVGVKVEMGDHFEMSLSYEGAWRGDYENHAGLLNAKYKF